MKLVQKIEGKFLKNFEVILEIFGGIWVSILETWLEALEKFQVQATKVLT